MALQQQGKDGEAPLGPDFRPGPYDVICHLRDKETQDHNNHFRELIAEHSEVYSQCKTRLDKSILVLALIDIIRERGSPGGGFIKFCHKRKVYVEIGDRSARQKVAHALRKQLSLAKYQQQRESSGEIRRSSSSACIMEEKKEANKSSTHTLLPRRRTTWPGGTPSESQAEVSPTSLLDMFLVAEMKEDPRATTTNNSQQIMDPIGYGSIDLEKEERLSFGLLKTDDSDKVSSFAPNEPPKSEGSNMLPPSSLSSYSGRSSMISSSNLDTEHLFQDRIIETCSSSEELLVDLDIESIFQEEG